MIDSQTEVLDKRQDGLEERVRVTDGNWGTIGLGYHWKALSLAEACGGQCEPDHGKPWAMGL